MQSENQADPPLAERPHHASPPDPRDDNLLATALKQLQSTQVLADWMSHYRSAIEDVPLCHVALPGTHDSGTYSLDPHCPYSIELRGSRMINLASLVGLGRLAKQIVLKWAVCQDQDTETQLAAGIRYFDLRVVAVKDEYRICHGLCGGLISDMLATFSNFVRAHPREIVILDLVPKNFYEFGVHSTLQIDHHLHFSKMLCDALQGVMCSSEHLRCDSTLREFWDSNTNIIVLYDPPPDLSPDLARLFWPPRSIQSYWPRHCKNALSWTKWAATHLSARPPSSAELFVLQGVITPDRKIISGLSHSARDLLQLSQHVNPHVIDLLVENPHLNHNITILDFYDRTPLSLVCNWINAGGSHLFTQKLGFPPTAALSVFAATTSEPTRPTDARLFAVGIYLNDSLLTGCLPGHVVGSTWRVVDVTTILPRRAPADHVQLSTLSSAGEHYLFVAHERDTRSYLWNSSKSTWLPCLDDSALALPDHPPDRHLQVLQSHVTPENTIYLVRRTSDGISLFDIHPPSTCQSHSLSFDQLLQQNLSSHPASFQSFLFQDTLYFFFLFPCQSHPSQRCSASLVAFSPHSPPHTSPSPVPLPSGLCLLRAEQWTSHAYPHLVLLACIHSNTLFTLEFDGLLWRLADPLHLHHPAVLRLFSLEDHPHLLLRLQDGLVVLRYSPSQPSWTPFTQLRQFTLSGLWDHDLCLSTLRVNSFDEHFALITARHQWGLLTVKLLSDGSWSYLGKPPLQHPTSPRSPATPPLQ